MFKKVFIFASIALLSSCVNKPHIERPSEDLLNQQISNRVESITKAAIKSEKKRDRFGIWFQIWYVMQRSQKCSIKTFP